MLAVKNIKIIMIRNWLFNSLKKGRLIPPSIPTDMQKHIPIALFSVGNCSRVIIVNTMLRIYKAALEEIDTT